MKSFIFMYWFGLKKLWVCADAFEAIGWLFLMYHACWGKFEAKTPSVKLQTYEWTKTFEFHHCVAEQPGRWRQYSWNKIWAPGGRSCQEFSSTFGLGSNNLDHTSLSKVFLAIVHTDAKSSIFAQSSIKTAKKLCYNPKYPKNCDLRLS